MTSLKDNKLASCISSTLCSVGSAMAVNPLEVMKIRQQAQNKGSFFKFAQTILVKEGIMTFYNGFSYTLMTNGISVGAYLFIYDYCKTKIQRYTQSEGSIIQQNSMLIPIIASTVSRFSSSTIFFPFECFKTLKQSHVGFTWVRFSDLFRTQGFKAYSITMQRDILLAQIYWVSAEKLRNFFEDKNLNSSTKNLIIGGLSGTISGIMTLPLDVIKTQKQTSTIHGTKSALQIAQEIYEKNGFKGFFLGFQPRILKISIHGAILIASYEYMYNYVEKMISKKQ